MIGIEDYGSGSESDTDNSAATAAAEKQASPAVTATHFTTSKSKLPPKTKRPKKIIIGLPKSSDTRDSDDDDLKAERPVAKKPRHVGAGASSLLSMLPDPKQKGPLSTERVLGSGRGPGLVFNTGSTSTSSQIDSTAYGDSDRPESAQGAQAGPSASPFPFVPTSLTKGRSNVSVEHVPDKPLSQSKPSATSVPTVDFFSLGSTSKVSTVPSQSSSQSPSVASLSMSSAPTIATFQPPEPTPSDPYPGYYQLPSGTWAAHDPVYYAKFAKKWQDEYDAHLRALEKGAVKGFEGLESASVENVDAKSEMEKAKKEIKEREERKALTKGGGKTAEAPNMKINASKMSGIARSRHQLSTLLKEAYENREALEERIAEGRRNRKEAGNKYGF